jgi:hypothetical protein
MKTMCGTSSARCKTVNNDRTFAPISILKIPKLNLNRLLPGYQRASTAYTCGAGGVYEGSALSSCTLCTPIAHWPGTVNCTHGADSRAVEPGLLVCMRRAALQMLPPMHVCSVRVLVFNEHVCPLQCEAGWVLTKGATYDYCQNTACPAHASPVDNAPETCRCDTGHFGNITLTPTHDWEGACTPCTAIVNGTGSIRCTTAVDSKALPGFACNDGFVLDTAGTADVCIGTYG